MQKKMIIDMSSSCHDHTLEIKMCKSCLQSHLFLRFYFVFTNVSLNVLFLHNSLMNEMLDFDSFLPRCTFR